VGEGKLLKKKLFLSPHLFSFKDLKKVLLAESVCDIIKLQKHRRTHLL
jgi:hypothetical protein